MAISASTTTAAVDALLKWKTKQTDSHNPQLLPQDEFIYLILTLKKIPQKGSINGGPRTNPHKIPLPHPLISQHSSELCLIIDDRPSSNLTSKIAKQKIQSESIPVSKVIKLSKLKTDYKPFESKRKLCDSYDMFFADKRVIPLLPKLLGKQFFKKKKLPLGVDLSHKNWKEQIERGCSAGLLYFRTGTCSVVRVGKVSMERDEIVENVRAAVDGVVGFVPKKLGGVRSLHLKFSDSVALPLYQSLPEIRLKIEGMEGKQEVMEIEGKKKESRKGRIHDIGNESEENDLIGGEVVEGDGGSDKKKRKGDGIEVGKKKRSKKGKIDEVSDDLDEVEVGKKKRSKRGKIDEVSEDLDGEEVKPVKESDKGKKKKGKVVEKHDVNTKSSDQMVKKLGKIDEVSDDLDEVEVGKKKRSKRGKIDEVSEDLDGDEVKPVKESDKGKKKKGNVVEKHDANMKSSDQMVKKKGKIDEVGDEGLEEVKPVKKSVKLKKRKGNAVDEDEVNTKSNEKIANKKGKKQDGDSGKKEKKKGRSGSRV